LRGSRDQSQRSKGLRTGDRNEGADNDKQESEGTLNTEERQQLSQGLRTNSSEMQIHQTLASSTAMNARNNSTKPPLHVMRGLPRNNASELQLRSTGPHDGAFESFKLYEVQRASQVQQSNWRMLYQRQRKQKTKVTKNGSEQGRPLKTIDMHGRLQSLEQLRPMDSQTYAGRELTVDGSDAKRT